MTLWVHEFTGKHLCQTLFFKACNVIKKQTLVQVFSCEFCQISKNAFFTEHLWVTASEISVSFWLDAIHFFFSKTILLLNNGLVTTIQNTLYINNKTPLSKKYICCFHLKGKSAA